MRSSNPVIFPAGAVLELCAGTLPLSLELTRQAPGRTVLAVDFCEDMLRSGLQSMPADNRKKRIGAVCGDGEEIPAATEKFWGVLLNLDQSGLALRGINVSSFDDWMFQVARREAHSLGLSTMFVPLFRIERIFLDEQIGEVESYRQRFEQQVGETVESYLGLVAENEVEPS